MYYIPLMKVHKKYIWYKYWGLFEAIMKTGMSDTQCKRNRKNPVKDRLTKVFIIRIDILIMIS